MALDLTNKALDARIGSLQTRFEGYSEKVRERNRAYLRAFSPEFDSRLGEHDQWREKIKVKDEGHTRSSFQIVRPVVELWTALEASEFPSIRWQDEFVPTPVPSLDPVENDERQTAHKASKLVERHKATLREELVRRQIRRSKLKIHNFRCTRRKNLFGHSWLKLTPDRGRKTFRALSKIDPATVYPVWSAWDDRKLEEVLVAYRKSARSVAKAYPGGIDFDQNDPNSVSGGYYQPSTSPTTEQDLSLVWVEDYWVLDEDYEEEVADEGEPVDSLVVNVVRVNGKIVHRVEYPGWRAIPYFLYENENERDHMGFSDAGTAMPVQDGLNRFLSQQQDVIEGESKPKFKYRGDSERTIELRGEEVVSLDMNEDIEQIATRIDVFPTQVHGTQLMEILARSTGLNDSVWGRIVASQNSGRALATAWRSVAARLVPRLNSATETITDEVTFMVDIMELYDWNGARALYDGDRDFEPDFPNQEPRDFLEVAQHSINLYNAGAIDQVKMMELNGEESPDEMQERVRGDYMDAVLHPEKSQAFLLLQRLKQQIQIEAQQAGMSMQAYIAQLAASPPGGAPAGGGTVEQQAGASRQATTQAQQQAAPQVGEGQNAPATQAGQAGNATKFSTLVQDGGAAQNRIIDQGTIR